MFSLLRIFSNTEEQRCAHFSRSSPNCEQVCEKAILCSTPQQIKIWTIVFRLIAWCYLFCCLSFSFLPTFLPPFLLSSLPFFLSFLHDNFSLWLQTVKGGISETRIEKRIVITGDADIDHDQVGMPRRFWMWEGFPVGWLIDTRVGLHKTTALSPKSPPASPALS